MENTRSSYVKAKSFPPADAKEYPSSYVFVLDVPGLKPGDIKVQIENGNVLSISGERKEEEQPQHMEEEEEKAKYLRMGRMVGQFMRKFTLTEKPNIDAISTAFHDAVLTLTVPKLPPPEPKVIEVKVA